jgi:hypothetical protein
VDAAARLQPLGRAAGGLPDLLQGSLAVFAQNALLLVIPRCAGVVVMAYRERISANSRREQKGRAGGGRGGRVYHHSVTTELPLWASRLQLSPRLRVSAGHLSLSPASTKWQAPATSATMLQSTAAPCNLNPGAHAVGEAAVACCM